MRQSTFTPLLPFFAALAVGCSSPSASELASDQSETAGARSHASTLTSSTSSNEWPLAVLEDARLSASGTLEVKGWAFQNPGSTVTSGAACSPWVAYNHGNQTIVRIFVDGMPYPAKFQIPDDLRGQGYGTLVSEIYPGDIARPDVEQTFAGGYWSGFERSIPLPQALLTPGYHTVHVLVLHACDDRYNVAAAGSPKVFGTGVPLDFPGMAAAHRGFDPGLTKRLLAGNYPGGSFPPSNLPHYQYSEFCPDRPGGCWNGGQGLAPGAGFYSVGNDADCRLDPFSVGYPQRQTYDNAGTTEYCPFQFDWQTDAGGQTAAQMLVDTTYFQSPITKNNYLGIQTNIPAEVYGGLSLDNPELTPAMNKVVAATITLEDTVCVPNPLPVSDADSALEGRYGRFMYNLAWLKFIPGGSVRQEISIDLKEWAENISAPDFFDTPYWHDASGHDPAHHMAATARYLAHPILNQINRVADCRQTAGGETTYIIPVRDLIARLVKEGRLPSDTLAAGSAGQPAQYSGGIIGGSEHWGRAQSRAAVKKHALYVDP